MKLFKMFLNLTLMSVMIFIVAGCAIQGTNTPMHKPAVVENSATPTPTPSADPLVKPFGGTVTYQDGVTVSVSTATPYQPSAEAAGAISGQPVLKFTLTVTNGSKDILKMIGYPDATSGSQQAAAVSDLGSQVGNTPDATLLQGQSIKWDEAFSVADPSDITMTYSPDMVHATAIFTTKE